MNNNLYPCLWFNQQAQQAATFYASVFNNTAITLSTPVVSMLTINEEPLMLLNGGPEFPYNHTMSLFVRCTSKAEVEQYVNALKVGGVEMLPLDAYPWSECYAWLADQFGVQWQIMLDPTYKQKLLPCFLFINHKQGKALEAANFYQKIFPKSKEIIHQLYGPNEAIPEGMLMYGEYQLNGFHICFMDSQNVPNVDFNESLSIVVNCDSQDEIDHYWNHLIASNGKESKCGWLKDEYGISWQIIPRNLGTILSNTTSGGWAMQQMLGMNKIIIKDLTA